MLKNISSTVLIFGLVGLSGCSSSKDSASTSGVAGATAVINNVDTALKAAGTSLGNGAASVMSIGINSVDDHCDANGRPTTNQASEYAARAHYCILAKDTGSPDTILGSYSLIKAISCALANSGVALSSTAQDVSITPSSACFSAKQLEDIGTQEITMRVKSTSPAEFNTNYNFGVELDIVAIGVTFKFATKSSDGLSEFIAYEHQGDSKTGAFGGAYDDSTGKFWYEARFDRYDCVENGSCGWSRHIRVHGTLDTSTGDPTNITDYQGIYSDIQKSNVSGSIYSLKGNLADGLKQGSYTFTNGGGKNLKTAADWATGDTSCFAAGGSGVCAATPSPLAIPTSGLLAFAMGPDSGYTSTSTWFAGLTGLSFSATSFADTQ